MGGIPIISDIIDAIQNSVGWVWTNSPDWLKLAIFIAIFTFAVSYVFLPVFAFLGWGHRILVSGQCQAVLAASTLSVANISNVSCGNMISCIINPSITPLPTCNQITNCINSYADSNLLLCDQCACVYNHLYNPQQTAALACDHALNINIFTNRSGSCADVKNTGGLGLSPAISLGYYCASEALGIGDIINYTSPYSNEVILACNNSGIDFLNPVFYLALTLAIPIGKFAIWWYTASGVMRPPIH